MIRNDMNCVKKLPSNPALSHSLFLSMSGTGFNSRFMNYFQVSIYIITETKHAQYT